jgi:serine protease Do
MRPIRDGTARPARLVRTIMTIAVLTVVATACSVDLASRGAGSTGTANVALQPVPEGKSRSLTGVVRAVLPAVVNVTTDVLRTDPFGQSQEGQGVGTGFIVRQDGVIVTNCHVVEGASRISVFTSASDPVRYDARVIGGDCLHDVAILKVGATGLPTVPLGESGSLQLGQQVVALGYALALEGGPTVTTGIVSALDRTIQAQDANCDVCQNGVRTYSDVIQTDAAINHGNSGGPLVDMAGRVVGINSAGSDNAENIGFAISIDSARDAIEHAISDPLAASAYLGVSTQGVNANLAYQLDLPVDQGAYVLATTDGGPAARAGIRDGDVIVSIDGQTVTSADDVGSILDGLAPGQRITVEVARGGGTESIDVTLGTRPLPTELP